MHTIKTFNWISFATFFTLSGNVSTFFITQFYLVTETKEFT